MHSRRNKISLYYFVVCLLLVHLQCKKEKLSDDTYFDSKVMILGHRGMGVYYKMPGDTYESIAPAIGIGADGCEIDTHLTKDSILVLYHDATLDDHSTCSGRINEFTWDELKGCKYAAVKNDIFICSLDDVFSRLPEVQNLYFSFDIQLDDKVADVDLYQSQYVRALKNICEKYKVTDNILIE
ncbi:MAG: hypothetical protein HY840_04310 [Bacteroidetes bacterium]|nr:hypothetical protein [Bacteroidota bacterium]